MVPINQSPLGPALCVTGYTVASDTSVDLGPRAAARWSSPCLALTAPQGLWQAGLGTPTSPPPPDSVICLLAASLTGESHQIDQSVGG